MTLPVDRVSTDCGFFVEEVGLPCGIRVRYGDEIVLTGTTAEGESLESRHGRVAAIRPGFMEVWLQQPPEFGDEYPPVAIPFANIESVTIYKRHWDDPEPGSEPLCESFRQNTLF